ncbi:MAG: type II toxin-antitoxin system VapC family toxin [Rhizobiaceae bacterium]
MGRVRQVNSGYLVDTHILLWSLHGDRRLKQRHEAILGSSAETFVSMATAWEIVIKVNLGKLDTVGDIEEALKSVGHQVLPVTFDHLRHLRELPTHHRDPFDRLIIAQAKTENMTILTADDEFAKYDVMTV